MESKSLVNYFHFIDVSRIGVIHKHCLPQSCSPMAAVADDIFGFHPVADRQLARKGVA